MSGPGVARQLHHHIVEGYEGKAGTMSMARAAAPDRLSEALGAVDRTGATRPHEAAPAALDALRKEALHQAIVRTLNELPEPSLRLLAGMAVVNQETPLPILAVLADVAEPSTALDHLVEAGLVDWFPHSLTERVGINSQALRDVVYWNLPVPLRREMHRAAAEQVSGVHEFRHLLLGASRRDPELAARLEDEAGRYHSAGDLERAGTLLLWSTDVSVDRQDRERRLLRAAEWGGQAPTAGWAAALSERLALLEPSVQRNLFLGRLAAREARFEAAQSLLARADELAAFEPAPVRTAVRLAAASLHAETGDLEAEEAVALSVLAREPLEPLDQESRQWSMYFAADAHGRMVGSAQASLSRLAELAPELAAASHSDRPGHGVLWWARGTWLVQSGRPTEAMSDLQRVLRSHDGPVEPVLPLTYAHLGYALFQLGDWRGALYEAQEGIRIAKARNDQRAVIPGAALAASISALSGKWRAAGRRAEAVARLQRTAGSARYGIFPALAAAHLAKAQGDGGRMLTALVPVAAQPALFAQCRLWWQPLYTEALIEAGRLDAARGALAALGTGLEPDFLPAAAMARLEAKILAAGGDPVAAIGLLALAVEQPPAEADSPFDLAELEHEYGRLLLAARRRRSAIRWLRSAYDRYVDLGAQPFAQQCLRQLTDSGAGGASGAAVGGEEPGAEPAGRSLSALTPQELRIAELAAEGMTNQQIARVQFVSAKTVEYHLGNIFAKLGIASRRQLGAVLEAAAGKRTPP
jgi:DNA-binding CsgD family transcriptional regulator